MSSLSVCTGYSAKLALDDFYDELEIVNGWIVTKTNHWKRVKYSSFKRFLAEKPLMGSFEKSR